MLILQKGAGTRRWMVVVALAAVGATMLLGAGTRPVQRAVALLGSDSEQPQPGGGGGGRGERGKRDGGGGRGLIQQVGAFQTDVPAHPFDIVLVRPTHQSVSASIVAYDDVEGCVEFGIQGGKIDRRTPVQRLKAGEPVLFEMDALKDDTAYSYRWLSRKTETKPVGEFAPSDTYRFHTPRAPGHGFVFTVQADSHLDANMTPAVYERALLSALADGPDFHVDLGDTFMVDKRRDFHEALPQYAAQRYYFGRLCASAPLFMVLGNHDGESGFAGSGPDQMGGWSFAQRTRLFPAPVTAEVGPGVMYTGKTRFEGGAGGGGGGGGANYYAFQWGDALLVVLDPFWATTRKMRGPGGGGGGGAGQREKGQPAPEADTTLTDEGWNATLGREQYDWLDRTLAASKARFKFVFTHHLVGGRGRAARGGVESAPYFEWGGKNADGTDGFASRRAGWAMPIQDLLVKRGVSALFHGHDHLYVHNELGGVTYQCVPQPGNVRGGTRSASEYGYVSGTILGSPGYIRVTVEPEGAKVAFVRSGEGEAAKGRRDPAEAVGAVAAEYVLKPRGEQER